MEKCMICSAAVAFGILLMLQCGSGQTLHVVGDTIGWTIPQNGGATVYQNWAASQKFMVGDILAFNFSTNRHDVLQVPKESYDSCSSANPIGNTITNGPANITLTTAGNNYYICTFSQHCQLGQKLSITVSASPGASPPSSTTPTPSPPPATNTPSATPSPSSGTPEDCAPVPAKSPSSVPTTGGPALPPPGSYAAGVFASFFLVMFSIAMGFIF
ncbi:cucumber peeling cupredoxin-like [Quillaja saponaria]|uniref:Cucumber peeling cupredoxin-like n=1 Tax=Quillaja saponaria TaxID=32244 RepID=A0AAD7L609_QUISA|nr:cucumber peeling cupredoxin-like [Quillaja saponaria]